MLKKILCSFLLLLIFSESRAQQDAQFSQYMYTRMFVNPAEAGADRDNMRLGAAYRNQWTGYSPTFDQGGAPVTAYAFIDAPIRLGGKDFGLGFGFVNDKIGPLTNTELRLSAAFHQALGKGVFSLGLRGGLYSRAIDFSQFRPNDPNDPLLKDNGSGNQFRSDFAVGINYAIKQYYIGMAFNHLTESQFDNGTGLILGGLKNHFNLTGGADFRLSPKTDLAPSFILRSDWNTLSWQFALTATYDGRYTLGSSLRSSNDADDLIFIAGTNLSKDGRLKISYALDYVLSGRTAKAGSSHEILLVWKLPMPKKTEKYIIRTPRFRF